MMPSIESSIVLIDQYYRNNHYHVTMVGVQINQCTYFSGFRVDDAEYRKQYCAYRSILQKQSLSCNNGRCTNKSVHILFRI